MARTPNIFFKDLPAVFHLASPQIVILDPLFLDGVATSLPSQKKLSSMGVRAALKPCLADTADGVCRIESPRNSADIACRVLTGPYGGPLPAPLVGLCAPAGREERTGGFNADHDAVDFPAAPRRSQTPSAPRRSSDYAPQAVSDGRRTHGDKAIPRPARSTLQHSTQEHSSFRSRFRASACPNRPQSRPSTSCFGPTAPPAFVSASGPPRHGAHPQIQRVDGDPN
jgi:hypothetical protein